MTNRTPIAINGRFLTRPATGVERVAIEVLKALVSGHNTRFSFEILMPACMDEAIPRQCAQDLGLPIRFGRTKGYVWEQVELPVMARGQGLFSPCNIGPVAKTSQAVVIHDAQVFDQPDSYGRGFRMAYHAILPRLGRRAKAVITVSDHSKARLAQHAITDTAQVIPNAVDHMDRITPATTDHEKPYVLALGSAAPHKNFAMLAEIFTTHPDLPPLIVAGGGGAMFQQAETQNNDRVQYLGRVSDEALAGLMQNAACFVFPSLTEGFGMPPLEAMWMGCPVIASTGGAVPQSCGDAAVLCDPTDPKAWVSALNDVLSTPKLQADLRRKGHAHARAYTWVDAANAYADVLEGIAK